MIFMGSIVRLKSVEEYNRLFGVLIQHPLVCDGLVGD